jgi:hypothetical protein
MLQLNDAAVLTVETCSQFTSQKGVIARIRPAKYYTIPEATMQRSYNESRELVQLIIVQSQKIVFCEEMRKTAAVSTVP